MNHKCKCGSDRFVRRWVNVHVHTPCVIDVGSKTIRMDYSGEEQTEDRSSFIEFYCENCETVIGKKLTRELVTEYEYA